MTERRFLPVIDRPLDNTAMTAYMTCPREYYFSMVLHRRHPGKSPPLVFGSAWHKALETRYKGGDVNLVRYAVSNWWETEGHNEPEDYRTLARCILDYDRYCKEFGEDGNKESDGKTLGAAGEMMVELSTNAQDELLIHPWAGKLDRIIDLGGLIYPEDHKTTSRLDKHFFRQFELSNQMMGYTRLGKYLLPQMPVVGVRINVSHVLTKETKFYRQLVTFGPQQLQRWANVMNVWMTKLAADYTAINAFADGKPLPLIPPDDIFVQHFGDNACSRKYGMCAYHPVCSSSPVAQANVLMKEFEINPWNPLKEGDDAAE